MAIFGPNEAEFQGGGSPFQPTAPVQDRASANLASTVGSMVRQGMATVGATNTARKEQEQEMQQDAVVGSFQNELLRYTRAHAQGSMSQQDAFTRMNVALSEFTERSPGSAKDLRQVMKDVMSTEGLGKGVAEGTAEEQFMEGLTMEAANVGAFDFNAPPERQTAQINDYLDMKRSQQQMEIERTQYQLTSARANAEDAELTAQLNQLENRQRVNSVNYAVNRNVTFRNQMMNLNNMLESGEIENKEQAIQMARDAFAGVESDLRLDVGSNLPPGHLSSLLSTFETARDDAIRVLSGEQDAIILENGNRALKAQAAAGFLQDPEMAAMASASQMFGSDVFIQQMGQIGLTNKFAEYFASFNSGDPREGENVLPAHTRGQEGFQQYVDALMMPALDRLNRGEDNEDLQVEVETQLTGMLNSVVDNAGSVRELTQFKPAISFLSSPQFGRYVEKNGVPDGVSADLAESLQFNYTDQIIPMIQEEWQNAQSRLGAVDTGDTISDIYRQGIGQGRQTVPTNQLIDVEFTGSGVRFVAPTTNMSREDLQRVRGIAQELNNKVGRVLNRDIKAMAHAEGHRKYREVFDQLAPRIFPEQDFPQGEQEEQ